MPRKKACDARLLTADDIKRLNAVVKRYRSDARAAASLGIHPSTLGRYLSGKCHPINVAALTGVRSAITRALNEVKP